MSWVEPGTTNFYPEPVAAAERSLVCLAMYDPASAFAVNLQPRHYFNPRFRAVWEAAAEVFTTTGSADPITTADVLQTKGTLNAVGGIAYLSKLFIDGDAHHVPSLASHYAELVRTASAARDLRRLVAEIPTALDEGTSLPEVLDRLRKYVDTVESGGGEDSCTTLDAEVALATVRMEENQARRASGQLFKAGLQTGLGLEKYVPGGIPTDKLTMLFGETGSFKTAIKQWIADQVALGGRYVLDFSIEDSAELTAQRFMARHTGIPYGRIVTGDVTASEASTIKELTPKVQEAAKRIIVVGNVPSTVDEAVRLSRYWARKVDLAAVFVDYITLLEMDTRGNEAQELYRVCLTAQRAAHRDKVAWVLLSQMNRKSEMRENKRPELGDMYGSSAMQQCAKLAVAIYRPWKYHQVPESDSPWFRFYNNAPDGPMKYRGALELWIRKNVLGESDVMCPVLVNPATGSFTPVTL